MTVRKVSNRETQYAEFRKSVKIGQKEDSNLKMENRTWSVGIGNSGLICMCLYPNRGILINRLRIPATGDIMSISVKLSKYGYVDDIPTLANLVISRLMVVKSSKS
jgi:hypothetical protein